MHHLTRHLWVALCFAAAPSAALAHPEATRTSTAVTPPRLIGEAAPRYPDSARADGVTGSVRVVVALSRTGTVTRVQLLEGVRADLDAAALDAARALRFEPARAGGVPIPATIRYHFHFTPPAEAGAGPAAPPDGRARDTAASEVATTGAGGGDDAPPVATATDAPTLAAVRVRGQQVRRSASEVVREREVLAAAPHRSADELLFVVPGVFITQHGGEGKAFQIFYRGFDAVHGQDLEIWAAGAPVNDVSNIHGQGYADLHFLPVEVVRTLRATPGTFDPHQGDFAVAGSLHLDVGLEHPGLTAKLALGEHGARRVFLGYRPREADEETFAAVELYHTSGFGPSRAAERASAVAQWIQLLDRDTQLRLFGGVYAGQFASAGVLKLDDIERGTVDRFATYDPTQGGSSMRAQVVASIEHHAERARAALSTYLVLRDFRLRENFTGFLTGNDGDSEQQLNDALVLGATGSYRRTLALLSPRDALEGGFSARVDLIEQSQRRLSLADGHVTADEVDATVRGVDVAGFVDAALFPWDRVALRGGVRLDGLSYAAEDRGGAARGQARSSQGVHVGAKGTLDVRVLPGLHALVSYGDGFRSPQARSLSEGQTTPFTTVRSGEVGLQLQTSWLRGSLAGFYTTLSDDLVFDHATHRNERVPSTRRVGASLDVEAVEWTDGLTLVASVTYTRSAFTASSPRFAEGDLLPYVPQLVARVDAAYTRAIAEPWGAPLVGTLGASLSALAVRPLPYAELGHDVALVDAHAALRLGPAELGVECFNLLGADWYDGEFVFATRWDPAQAGSLVPQRMVTAGAPRTLLATLSVTL